MSSPATLSDPVLAMLGRELAARFKPDQPALPTALQALVERLTAALHRRERRVDAAFERDLFATLPPLRAYAISLAGSLNDADDLVQETVLKALRNVDKFEPGTNLQGWLFTILRNQFYSEHRKWHREVNDPDGVHAAKLSVLPEQEARVGHQDLLTALAKLPVGHREAIVLVGAQGMSYEEAAAICGVPIGTIKSRVNRARIRLAELMGLDARGPAAHGAILAAAGAPNSDPTGGP